MGSTALVIGATGLVGRELVSQLLSHREISLVKVFTRRPSGVNHPRLEEHIVDFDKIDDWSGLLTGDVLFSALGTTLKQAGSKKAQYKVDYTYQHSVAQIAAANGVSACVLVSSAGADGKSPLFYSRMKGSLDEALQKMSFKRLIILRPSLLTGNREKPRPAEKLAGLLMRPVTRIVFRNYRPVQAQIVASAMINAGCGQNMKGNHIIEPGAIFALAETIKQ